jgi:hypothetical protein
MEKNNNLLPDLLDLNKKKKRRKKKKIIYSKL